MMKHQQVLPATRHQTSEELLAFRCWVRALTTVSISYEADDPELLLLLEMVDRQPPEPTPIHPRAIPYRPVATRDLYVDNDSRHPQEQRFRGRQRTPRWFQWIPRSSSSFGNRKTFPHRHHKSNNNRKRSRPTPSYDVCAKRFAQPDGEVYTLGCTEEQRQADQELQQMCLIVQAQHLSSSAATTVQLQWRLENPRRLYRLIWIASRGHAFATVFPSHTENSSTWLNPVERWFSLSMFLASRLELALWKSYYGSLAGGIPTSVPPLSLPMLRQELKDSEIRASIARAVGQHFRTLLSNTPVSTLIDEPLWKLLNSPSWSACSFRVGHSTYDNRSHQKNDEDDLVVVLNSLSKRWLVAPREPSVEALRQSVAQALHQDFLQATERSLLSMTLNAQPPPKESKRAKKRKNKKKRSKAPPPPVIPEREDPISDGSQGEDNYTPTTETASAPQYGFPQNGTSSRDRSRNVVTALGILDVVLSNVFVQVGLENVSQVQSSSENNLSSNGKSQRDAAKLGGEANAKARATNQPTDDAKQRGGMFRLLEPSSLALGLSDRVVDEWGRLRGFASPDRSLLEEFFESQRDQEEKDRLESSTAASFASSREQLDVADLKEFAVVGETKDQVPSSDATAEDLTEKIGSSVGDDRDTDVGTKSFIPIQVAESSDSQPALMGPLMDETEEFEDQSLSPPSTPSPRLSPILLTLSDISRMKRESTSEKPGEAIKAASMRSVASFSALSASAKSDSQPMVQTIRSSRSIDGAQPIEHREGPKRRVEKKLSSLSPALTRPQVQYPHRSRDDHDIKSRVSARKSADVLASYRNKVSRTARDDHDIGRFRTHHPKSLSYRAAAATKPIRPESTSRFPLSHFQIDSAFWKEKANREVTAQSDISIDINDDYQNWPDLRRSQGVEDGDNNTVTRDGSTTITSALSQREADDTAHLREERDSYRDLCLTLGAEVAKLRSMLAAQKTLANGGQTSGRATYLHSQGPFAPHAFEHVRFPRSHTAMSDAGFRGEYESQASEDDAARLAESARQLSSVATHVGSDLSTSTRLLKPAASLPARQGTEPAYVQGMQSRLTKDLVRFLNATDLQLKRQDPIKAAAIERMTRLINTIWPRAQVKLYGSNVTGLALPGSDLDFVICLPAVHKKAVAVAPGVLEGRNAINETSQKLLARTLKGESWIDPRSMKLIERTVVPVIKVATKDTKARSIQLDITFDSPGHHGIEAVQMVTHIMDELPMIRPLLLILKQFLSHRGLLTAYTGGLSAYGLFLMIARYLQEQDSWGDCGSLLMGFLDFYGNNFDPRSTGISVRSQVYFPRISTPPAQPPATSNHQATWRQHPVATPQPPQFFRRYSFSDKGNIDAQRGANPVGAAPQPHPVLLPRRPPKPEPKQPRGPPTEVEHSAMPYTLDPLLIEDPLDESNNVGRNAFRIFSVLRAFSDAHRALVASLEWDIQSTTDFHDDSEYPLLKCLLQNEDFVFNDIGR